MKYEADLSPLGMKMKPGTVLFPGTVLGNVVMHHLASCYESEGFCWTQVRKLDLTPCMLISE